MQILRNRPLTTAPEELDDLDRDLSKVSDLSVRGAKLFLLNHCIYSIRQIPSNPTPTCGNSSQLTWVTYVMICFLQPRHLTAILILAVIGTSNLYLLIALPQWVVACVPWLQNT